MRVDLGEGQWAEIREPGELRRADKKHVLRVVDMEIDPAKGKAYVNGASDDDQIDALLERVVTQWSFQFPLPSQDKTSLGKLTLDQGDALAEAVRPHMELINKRVDPSKRDSDPTAG